MGAARSRVVEQVAENEKRIEEELRALRAAGVDLGEHNEAILGLFSQLVRWKEAYEGAARQLEQVEAERDRYAADCERLNRECGRLADLCGKRDEADTLKDTARFHKAKADRYREALEQLLLVAEGEFRFRYGENPPTHAIALKKARAALHPKERDDG